MPLLKIQNLSFAYGQQPVLDNINFKLQKGDFWAIIGPNGGGKTTLMKLILGLLKPQSGSITFAEGFHPMQIGYVPQTTHNNIHFPIQVFDVVKMGFLHHSPFGFRVQKNQKEMIKNTLKKLCLSHLTHKLLSELSGGERQRVLIARAFVSQPTLIILDEPTSNVDAYAQNEIYEILSTLQDSVSILIVSHDLSLALKYAHKTLYVNRQAITQPTLSENYCEADILSRLASQNGRA